MGVFKKMPERPSNDAIKKRNISAKSQNIICFSFIVLTIFLIVFFSSYFRNKKNIVDDYDNNSVSNSEKLENEFKSVKKNVTTYNSSNTNKNKIIGEKLQDSKINNEQVKKIYELINKTDGCNIGVYGEYDELSSLKTEFTKDIKMFFILNNYGLKSYENNDNNNYYYSNDAINAYKKIYSEDYGKFTKYEFDIFKYDENTHRILFYDSGCALIVKTLTYKYEEIEDEINIYSVYAYVQGDGSVYKNNSNDSKQLVYENLDEFYFTEKNINKFDKMKFNFKKNDNGIWTIKYLERIK